MAAPEQSRPGRRRGRRPGGADTRAQLLDAARAEFAERGFDGATVRAIAERAGVDAAMVNHWFGGKEALFTASLNIPVDPAALINDVLPGPPEAIAWRIVPRFLQLWDTSGGGQMVTLVRSIAAHEAAARMMREFVSRVILKRVVEQVAPDRYELRAALAGTQLIGLGMVRYVLRLEPLASADHATVVAAVAPNLQRYLTGDLDAPAP
ncbi:TetR/AcrR family transcriptional regulator [Pseudonocardia humida]|uniref:TetR family transcriptional regulator n=1 Tax=Pseudonocardia humida TaxID=2800819 RepID=A0ABT0ZYX4_9PSEU|nr:TetR family transcriptional regulator [Pseudonocardia humida]MCO1655947.1 TetR family transcriptional regulator [Pseudonocardia humida]